MTAAFNIGMYIGAFRVLTPKGVPIRQLIPGAITGGILWTVLQFLGTYLVHHYLHSDSVYGVFGTVLGLLAWIYIAVEITVYSAEINVVLSRRLWPRSIVQPPLTEADRASMALQALQNQRRPEQHIEVTFDDRPPESRPPPGRRRHRTRSHRPRSAGKGPPVRRRTQDAAPAKAEAPPGRPAQTVTGRSEAASSRSWVQVALPVTTTVRPAAVVYVQRALAPGRCRHRAPGLPGQAHRRERRARCWSSA